MEERVFTISQILTIKIRTSNRDLIRLFTTRFSDLYHGNKTSENHITINLIEVPKFEIISKKVLREITLPELCVFDGDEFLVVQGRRYISIPFGDIGKKQDLEIKFEKGFPPDWIRRLLDDLLAFHVTGFEMSFVHAACLSGDANEIIIPAWRGTGKTTLTLSFLFDQQYSYKAEDQFIIDRDGNSYIYTDACHVDQSHMKDFPQIRERFFSPVLAIRAFFTTILLPFFPPKNVVFVFIRRAILKVLSPKVYVKIRKFIPDLKISHSTNKKRFIFQLVTQPDLEEPEIKKIEADQTVNEILGGMQYERLDFYQFYFAWVYASGKRNQIIDNVHHIESEILKAALENAECYKILVPRSFNKDSFLEKLNQIIK